MRKQMKKALVYLDEDLASSMALRYAATHTGQLGMALQVIHVVELKPQSHDDTGWVRRSWEKQLMDEGRDEVSRLVKTENIAYVNAGEPKIALGDKDTEILQVLNDDSYALYFEGFMNGTNNKEFLDFLSAKRFQEMSCPLLIVKNLVAHENLLLLIDDDVDAEIVVSGLNNLYDGLKDTINLTVLYYRYMNAKELSFLERKEAGHQLDIVEQQLDRYGWDDPEWMVMQGLPDKAAEYMRGYGLVVTAFPSDMNRRAELLAYLANPLLLLRK